MFSGLPLEVHWKSTGKALESVGHRKDLHRNANNVPRHNPATSQSPYTTRHVPIAVHRPRRSLVRATSPPRDLPIVIHHPPRPNHHAPPTTIPRTCHITTLRPPNCRTPPTMSQSREPPTTTCRTCPTTSHTCPTTSQMLCTAHRDASYVPRHPLTTSQSPYTTHHVPPP